MIGVKVTINWDEVQKAIYPTKNYEEICQRLNSSFSYRFVCDAYNFHMPKLEDYTEQLLGGDARGRYSVYKSTLKNIIAKLPREGVGNVLGLIKKTSSKPNLESLVSQSGIPAIEIATVLKYLLYWVIPGEKYLSGLVRGELYLHEAIRNLHEIGIRYNLELLQDGLTSSARNILAVKCQMPVTTLTDLVHRADFSRLPWASKATISNIIGAGYSSLAKLAAANPQQLIEDFFHYGSMIGKNLKYGNEIGNSYRIAKIIPKAVH
jgi:hypothetical protein